MNKKILKATLAGTAVVALAAGGGTMASWSDFQNIEGNQTGAGVLTLDVGPNHGSDFVFDHVKMAPGGLDAQRNVYVASNDLASTPSGQLYLSLKDIKGHEDGCDGNGEAAADPSCSDTSGDGQFVDDAILQVSSYAVNSPGDCTQSYAPASKVVTAMYGGSFNQWKTYSAHELTGNGIPLGGVNRSYLAPGQGLCVSMQISLGYSADNASQGDDVSFTTHFELEQAPYGTPTTPLAP
jgi:predicted ribosomally synthesized peptide with SipW-like signal peptide